MTKRKKIQVANLAKFLFLIFAIVPVRLTVVGSLAIILRRIIALFFLIFLISSCAKIKMFYHQEMMQEDITQNRKNLYQQSFGEVDDEQYEIE